MPRRLTLVLLAAALIALPARALDPGATSIATFGAKPGSDCTSAMRAAIAAAQKTPSKIVYVPAGNYRCAGFTLDGVKLVGEGADRSVLTAPDPEEATITLTGNGAGISNLGLVTKATDRVGGADRIKVDDKGASFIIANVAIDGSNATGIIVYGATGRITGNRVRKTMADAIHLSGHTHTIYVAGNLVRQAGDDCIAVVTYDKKNPPSEICRDILIENNDVGDQLHGRGISVVGGRDVTIRHNMIARTSMAGIYLASEAVYETRGVANILVEGNRITAPSQGRILFGHPAILVFSSTSFPVSGIKIIDNTVVDSPNGAFGLRGPLISDVFLSGNTYNGQPFTLTQPHHRGASATGATVTSSLLNGAAVPAP